MNRIMVETNIDTCYVYHMLAVAQCGYDNPYGTKYRSEYPSDHLRLLKQNEKHMSVRGGEHCGQLYYPLITLPARGEKPAKQVYEAMIGLFEKGISSSVSPGWMRQKYELYGQAVVAISAIMAEHYDDYCRRIHPQIMQGAMSYVSALQGMLDSLAIAQCAADMLQSEVKDQCFHIRLCPSMENGPQAIDISENVHVFGMHQPPESALRLIVHEYVIALLKPLLWGTSAFISMDSWRAVEGLAEFYCVDMLGWAPAAMLAEMVQQYESLAAQRPGMSPRNMFLEIREK